MMRKAYPVVLVSLLFFTASTLSAQGCKISGGKVDLNVLFLYNETDLDGWKPVFTEASKLLYNATDGNLQIGEVNLFVACQPAKDKGAIWISSSPTGGASAHPDGCGKAGQHVFLSNRHKRNDTTARGQLGIVHELGHYIFNLADEYGGSAQEVATGVTKPPLGDDYMWHNSGSPGASIATLTGGGKAFLCTQASGGTGCIMDAGTTVTSAFSRTEFCTDSDHVRSRQLNALLSGESSAADYIFKNNQEAEHGVSCWAQVAAKLGLSSAPNPPSTTPPSGHQDVVFNDLGAAARFVLTVDASGSMAGTPIALAKTAASCFVENSRLPRMEFGLNVPGDEVGVVSFSTSASVVSSLTELLSQADKDMKKAAIGSITASGATSIGGGLRTSLNQLTGRGGPGCIEAIVLLSDGMHNSGENPASVIPDIVARKATVFSVGLGSGADTAQLSSIASGTGGKFFFAASATELPVIFSEIQATVTGAAILERVKRTLNEGGSEVIPVLLDASIERALFTSIGEGFAVRLTSPSGAVSDSVTQAPGVSYMAEDMVQAFSVENAEAGTWQFQVTRTLSGPGLIEMIASGSSLGTHLQAVAPANLDFQAAPAAKLLVQAALSEGPGVAGAAVSAEVTRPDGTIRSLVLKDDGRAENGDDTPNDGLYSAFFRDLAGDGAYTFQIRADTTGGSLVTGEDGPEAGVQIAATKAIRMTTVTTVVSNAAAVLTVISAVPGSAPSGAQITITGTGFLGAVEVLFGTKSGVNVQVVNNTMILVTVPSGLPGGPIDITITTSGGSVILSGTGSGGFRVQGLSTQEIPTLSEWGLGGLTFLLFITGLVILRQRKTAI